MSGANGEHGGSKQAIPDGFDSWNAFWTAQGMPWRTEPEISKERQRYLAERRAVKPDIERGIYPFRDETSGGIKLARADVEWLLATHESAGITGPVEWPNPTHRWRKGLDLRGAVLTQENLQALPLARLQGGLSGNDFDGVNRELATRDTKLAWAAIHLEQAVLSDADLQGSGLVAAHLEGATLHRARLEGTDLFGVYLAASAPADLSGCLMNEATAFREVHLVNAQGIGPRLRRVHYGGAQLVGHDWEHARMLADERDARARLLGHKRPDRRRRIREYGRAISANQLLASALRSQGFSEVADKYAYRVRLCERRMWRLQRKYLRYVGSLGLGIIAGYGYKPLRSVVTYVLVVLGFAVAYFFIAAQIHVAMPPLAALVFSVTSFHGRGFAPGENVPLTNPLSVLAAGEAIIGLLIEITFIATFTQRFFAR